MARTFTYTTEVFDEYTDFPQTGDVDVIYIDASKNKAYRYDQSYYPISSEGVDIWGAIGSLSKGGGGGGGASWGTITGTLSNQTDLNTALSAKQDALTLTTTGTSGAATLVGRTLNIPQYGGGGLKGVHKITQYLSNTNQGNSAALNGASNVTIGVGTNQLIAYPFIPNKGTTSGALKINVTTLGAGVNCRILIYSDSNGMPSSKLYESTDLSCSTTGIKTAVASFNFFEGTVYWLCVQSSGPVTLTALQPSALIPLAMLAAFTSAPVVGFVNSSIYGSAPTTFLINNTYSSSVPLIGIYNF
jgi:hypothetical protein